MRERAGIGKRAAGRFEGSAARSPVQRDGGRRSRPGVNPFIPALTAARCPAAFSGVRLQLRDVLSTSRSAGRGTGAFIYAQSAVETRPALAFSRRASTALYFLPLQTPLSSPAATAFKAATRQRVAIRFACKVTRQGGQAPLPPQEEAACCPLRDARRPSLLGGPPAGSVEQKSAWDWRGILSFGELLSPACLQRDGKEKPKSTEKRLSPRAAPPQQCPAAPRPHPSRRCPLSFLPVTYGKRRGCSAGALPFRMCRVRARGTGQGWPPRRESGWRAAP